jgi:diguanylate cyclase (GGDEF)-like protein
MVLANLVFVVGLAAGAKYAADRFSTSGMQWTVFLGVAAAGILLLAAIPLRMFLLAQRSEAAKQSEGLREQNLKQEFDGRLVRAFDMADSEQSALAITTRALAQCGDDLQGQVLFADSSDAHLQTVAVASPNGSHGCCEVATPRGCPAIRNGHSLHFDQADQLDACPYLFERSTPAMSAVCVPVSIVGRATGVVHATRIDRPFSDAERDRIESVARQAGQRVGMLRATAQTQLQASTDPLTGLLNRRSMENEVRQLVKQEVPYTTAILDLDHFKMLNDTYGHETGDRALRVFSRTLRNTVRATDIVSRHGGEEFVVVFPHASADAAVAVIERVRMELVVALSDGRTPMFTMSAGVADSAEAADSAAVLAIADERLLMAKRTGRDRVVAADELAS